MGFHPNNIFVRYDNEDLPYFGPSRMSQYPYGLEYSNGRNKFDTPTLSYV